MYSRVRMPFGKYEGKPLAEILIIAPSYVRWLSEACADTDIKYAAAVVLGKLDIDKIQTIVKEALMHRGYSESEALMFIRTLKNKD